MTIIETIEQLAAKLAGLPDWEDRYTEIIAMGKGLPLYPEEFRSDQFKVKGCQSQVWLHPRNEAGVLHFDADSDALIVKGLVALLMNVYSGRTPAEIVASNDDIAKELSLEQHLSPNRANGLASMIKQIRLYALAYSLLKP
ncbi:MAG: SufE family protein [Ignavibacteria bacterium]|nr:SufE family protein [Ignavibacteria bacterium]